MSPKFLLQTVALLFLGQALLGGFGWLLVETAPWAGLPVLFFLVWFIRRTSAVFREEMAAASRRGEPVQPGRLAFFVALAAQVPGLALLPYWAPEWILPLWQGAVLPVVATLGLLWPEGGALALPWLWLAALAEIALFVSTAVAAEKQVVQSPVPVKPAAGEWAPARRHSAVERRGRRVR